MKDLNTLLVSNKHWFSIPHEMMHDFTPSQIISETFCCLLLSALYLCRGFERVCVVACSAVMWGFCYPAELPELVQIAWILSFCSPNHTKPLTETQRYRRERANESSNLSKGYLYSSWSLPINTSPSSVWSPCCPLPVHPLKLLPDPVLLWARQQISYYWLQRKHNWESHPFGSSRMPATARLTRARSLRAWHSRFMP